MASMILSSEEKHYILTGVEDDFRNDGRSNEDYRRISVKTRVLSNTNGSADITLVRLGACSTITYFFQKISHGHTLLGNI